MGPRTGARDLRKLAFWYQLGLMRSREGNLPAQRNGRLIQADTQDTVGYQRAIGRIILQRPIVA